MADEFLKLASEERREVINAAAPELGILPAVAEKDVWVCFVLNVLFSIPDRRPMVFKGGTSLSKVFKLIKRFSEDSVPRKHGGRECNKQTNRSA